MKRDIYQVSLTDLQPAATQPERTAAYQKTARALPWVDWLTQSCIVVPARAHKNEACARSFCRTNKLLSSSDSAEKQQHTCSTNTCFSNVATSRALFLFKREFLLLERSIWTARCVSASSVKRYLATSVRVAASFSEINTNRCSPTFFPLFSRKNIISSSSPH